MDTGLLGPACGSHTTLHYVCGKSWSASQLEYLFQNCYPIEYFLDKFFYPDKYNGQNERRNRIDRMLNGMDERELFRMCKRQVANEQNFYRAWEERCSDISHQILSSLDTHKLIAFEVSETLIKNIIFNAINEYSKIYDKAEEAVIDKLKKYKRKLIYGTEEYEIVFSKLYEEELRKRGLL